MLKIFQKKPTKKARKNLHLLQNLVAFYFIILIHLKINLRKQPSLMSFVNYFHLNHSFRDFNSKDFSLPKIIIKQKTNGWPYIIIILKD